VPADDGRSLRDRAAQVRGVAPTYRHSRGSGSALLRRQRVNPATSPLIVIPAQAGIQLRAGVSLPPLPSSVPESLDPRLRGDDDVTNAISAQSCAAMPGAAAPTA